MVLWTHCSSLCWKQFYSHNFAYSVKETFEQFDCFTFFYCNVILISIKYQNEYYYTLPKFQLSAFFSIIFLSEKLVKIIIDNQDKVIKDINDMKTRIDVLEKRNSTIENDDFHTLDTIYRRMRQIDEFIKELDDKFKELEENEEQKLEEI